MTDALRLRLASLNRRATIVSATSLDGVFEA